MKLYALLFFLFTSCFSFAQNDINQKVLSAEKDIDPLTKIGRVLIDRFQTDDREKYGSHEFMEFEIRAMRDTQSDSLVLNIECLGDALGNDWIRVMPEDMALFIQSMNIILEKFIEWSDVAKTNSITDFHKVIPLSSEPIIYHSYIYTDAKRDSFYLRKLVVCFFVDKSGTPSVSFGLRKKESSIIDHKMVFISVEKLEHLIYLIQPTYVSTVFEKTQQKIKELDEATISRDALFK
jgi:hypothetical protein